MNKIEKYIKSLCRDMYLCPEQAKEFKEEIRTHLVETVKELQTQGKSEEESVDIAIKRFGEEKQLNIEFRKVFKFQKKFKKALVFISMVFLIMSVIFFVALTVVDGQNRSDFDGMQHDFMNQVGSKITAGDIISSEDIGEIFNKYKRGFRYIYIRQINNDIYDYNENSKDKVEYLYPANISKKELDKQAYFTYEITSEKDNTIWEARIAYNSEVIFTPVINVFLVISIICFIIYWILFGIWGIIDAFHMNRLNVIWGILFFALNIIAYLLFIVKGKRKVKKLYSTHTI